METDGLVVRTVYAEERAFQTMQGEIAADWKRDGENFTMGVTIPCNTAAEIILPNGET